MVAFHKALRVAFTVADQVRFRNQILAAGALLPVARANANPSTRSETEHLVFGPSAAAGVSAGPFSRNRPRTATPIRKTSKYYLETTTLNHEKSVRRQKQRFPRSDQRRRTALAVALLMLTIRVMIWHTEKTKISQD